MTMVPFTVTRFVSYPENTVLIRVVPTYIQNPGISTGPDMDQSKNESRSLHRQGVMTFISQQQSPVTLIFGTVDEGRADPFIEIEKPVH